MDVSVLPQEVSETTNTTTNPITIDNTDNSSQVITTEATPAVRINIILVKYYLFTD